MTDTDIPTAVPGQTYLVTTIGTRRGQLVTTERAVTFEHAYPCEEEFAPARGQRPAQTRIFVRHPHGVVPMLIVQGSMRASGGALA